MGSTRLRQLLSQTRYQYLLAIACVALAFGLGKAIVAAGSTALAYLPFYVAVVAIARYTSIGPSVCAAMLSLAVASLAFETPQVIGGSRYEFFAARIVIFGAIIFLGEGLRRASSALLQRARDQQVSEERLLLTLDASNTGIWEWNVKAGTVSWSSETHRICGVPIGQFGGTPEAFEKLVHPEDSREFWEKIRAAVATGTVFSHEFRIVQPSGKTIWVSNLGRTSLSDSGEPVSLLGTVTDITSRKLAELERYKFVSLAENSTDFIGVCDLDFRPTYVNPAGLKMVGFPNLEAAKAARVQDWFFPEDLPFIEQQFFPRVLREGSAAQDIRFRHFQTGEPVWVNYKVSVTFDTAGRPTGYATVTRNVTEERRAQLALQETNERLLAALNGAQAGTFRWNIQTNELDWDENLDRLFGLPPGRTIRSLENFIATVHHEDRPGVIERCERCAKEGVDFSMQFRVVHPDGSLHWLDDKGKTYFDANGLPLYMAGACVDITSQKEAEALLRAANNTFRHLVENSPFGVYVIDSDFRLVQVSAGAQKVFQNVRPLIGRAFDEVLRSIWTEPFASEAIARFRHTLETGEPFHAPSTSEKRLDIDEDESYDWKIERLVLPDGRFGVVCNFYDLSERQRFAETLGASEERFRSTFDNAAVGIAHVGLDGQWLRVNDKLCQIIGYSRNELLNTTFQAITHPEDLAGDVANTEKVIAGTLPTYSIEKRYIRHDGTIVPVNLTVSLSRDEQGRPLHFISVIEDITERKRAEELLRSSEEFSRSIADVAPNILYVYDLIAKRNVWGNQGVQNTLGYSFAEIAEMGPQVLPQLIHPDDWARYEQHFQHLVSLRDGEIAEFEYRMRTREGSWCWLRSREMVFQRAVDGRARQIIGAAIDITERKQAEDALRKAEKLAGAGQMAAVVAHEINNPLAGVVNALFLLGTQPMTDEAKEYYRLASQELDRVVHITKQTLAFYRESEKASLFDVAQVAREVVSYYQPMAARKRMTLEVVADAPNVVYGFSGELRQVLSNLATNALESGGTCARIHVNSARNWNTNAPMVRIHVTDDGKGISRRDQQRIFEPFFTTKGEKGTGLGLWVTRAIITKHEGQIRVRSREGAGTSMSILLPLATADAVRARSRGAIENVA